ncbi:MAG: prolyl oligopeptidase family serine peptidase [Bdellovibrionales bacterium]
MTARRCWLWMIGVALTLVLGGVSRSWSDNPPANSAMKANEKNPLTVEDILAMESASDFYFSPDGKQVVWVKESPNKKKGEMVQHLVLTDLETGKDIVLTRGSNSCTNPRWSPEGKLIAFLSDRPPTEKDGKAEEDKEEDRKRIWLINPRGGEAWQIGGFPRDVRDLAWLDEETVLFLAQEKAAHREKDLEEKKDQTQVVEDEKMEPPVRLFKMSAAGEGLTRITDNKDRIKWFSLSHNRRWLVAAHERSLSFTFDQKEKPKIVLHDLEEKKSTAIFSDRKFNVRHVAWRPDSKGFYAVSSFTSHPRFVQATVDRLYYFDMAKKESALVDLGWDKGLATSAEGLTITDDGFLALLADGIRHKPARFRLEGNNWKRKWLESKHGSHMHFLKADDRGEKLIYLHSSASTPNHWYFADLEENKVFEPAEIFELGPDLSDRDLARVETVRWKGALNEEVEGLLYYPLDYQSSKKYPLVVQIHGGPHGADFDQFSNDWAYAPQLLCARGAFVFQPNYHGSSNYGLAWAESLAGGKYYDLPIQDIEKGIDHLVASGKIDAAKIALSGWSNGAILTMALLTRRSTYRAASAGAGGSEWVADWGACEFGLAFSNYYLGKSPLEDPQLYRKNSPFFDFAKIKTPTILFQGTEDRVVPAHHGWMQYRALQQLAKAPVRFLLFPGEKHSLSKLPHQKRKLEEELAWFDRYLFTKEQKVNLAFKADSPLAQALARGKASKEGSHYGKLFKGKLIPETVDYGDLNIGKFEVTRAQFRAFDPKFVVDHGTENFPASGITFDQAKKYCLWLSELTEEKYRLGTLEEMKEFYEGGEGEENTLDNWAG